MTPGQIIALVRDVLIVLGVGFLVWHIYEWGGDRVRKQDLEAVQKQLAQNAQRVSQWEKLQNDAEAQRQADMGHITAAIDAQHAPVRLCNPRSAGPVPSHPPAPLNSDPAPWGVTEGAGRDIRPDLNAFELRIESLAAACRALRDSWPK